MTPEEARKLLGLPASHGSHDVKEAWRAAARRWHPDRVDPDHREQAAETFTQLQQAYLLLVKDSKQGHQNHSESSSSAEDHDPFAWFDGPTRPGSDLFVTLPVTLADLMRHDPEPLNATVTYPVPCPQCSGEGCRQCSQGAIEGTFTFTTAFPQGLTGSTTVVRPRRGAPGWGGGSPGDAHVTYEVVCGSNWTLDNGVPVGTVVLSTAQYLAGGNATIVTPDGRRVSFGVPSQPALVTVPDAGLVTSDGRGVLLVDVQVRPLDVNSPAVRSALQGLHESEGGVGQVGNASG